MSVSGPILIVDPIFRGSRLMYSAYAAEALVQQGAAVTVLTRKEVPTDHYRELFSGVRHDLQSKIPVPPATWYAKLSLPLIRNCLSNMADLHKSQGFAAVLCSGWNEFFPKLALARPKEIEILRRVDSYWIEYSPFFWLKRREVRISGRLQDEAKRLIITRLLRSFPRLRFLVLDERLFDPGLSALPPTLRDRYFLLPEPAPWATPGGCSSAKQTKELLVVGLQTRRKGLVDLLAVLAQPDFPPNLRIRLVGRLGEDLQHLRSALEQQRSPRFVWEEAYLSEADIRQRYAQCDYVLIPYTPEFNSTSSVLAWACAHGKPVITTDHGLVGYRVAKHQLGAVYHSGGISALTILLKNLPEVGAACYQEQQRACWRFAEQSRLEVFKRNLCQHFLGAT